MSRPSSPNKIKRQSSVMSSRENILTLSFKDDACSHLLIVNNILYQLQSSYYKTLKGSEFAIKHFTDQCSNETRIGEGYHGTIYKTIMREYKFIVKKMISFDNALSIEKIMQIDTKYLAKYFDSFVFANNYFIVMENIEGFNFSKINDKFMVKNKDYKKIIDMLFKAVLSLHSLDMSHNDISPLNFMCEIYNNHIYNVRIIDYSFIGLTVFAKNALWYLWVTPINTKEALYNDLKSFLLILKVFEIYNTVNLDDVTITKQIASEEPAFSLQYDQLKQYIQEEFCYNPNYDYLIPIIPKKIIDQSKKYTPNKYLSDTERGYNNVERRESSSTSSGSIIDELKQ